MIVAQLGCQADLYTTPSRLEGTSCTGMAGTVMRDQDAFKGEAMMLQRVENGLGLARVNHIGIPPTESAKCSCRWLPESAI